jgi:hypothetical protein
VGTREYLDDVIRRSSFGLTVVLAVVTLSGCGWFGDNGSTSASDGGMRPVPTVPTGDTAVPVSIADDALAPPVTEVVGDPQPDPDSPDTLPPLPDQPVVNACSQLDDLSTADVIGAAVGSRVSVESIWDEACRFTSGTALVEIHYVPDQTVNSDWFRRDGIEPVGAVGGDAVGIATYAPPGSDEAPGYTIALVERRHGAVVAVSGTTDDRGLAEQLAVLVVGSL